MNTIPIIIPAYEPGSEIISFIKSLNESNEQPIIVVDDGSGKKYRTIFDQIKNEKSIYVLRHAVNLGKGRALKTAFNFVLNEFARIGGGSNCRL